MSLDGPWEFEFDPDDIGIKKGWHLKRLSETIRVPYCVQSEASGLGFEKICPVFWYGKQFPRTALPEGTRFFLNFGAVDYEADVWINGNRLGGHRGGYTPFSFEITDFLEDTNRISVRVADYPTKRTLRGKQYIYRRLSAVFYTPVSGIWQPVFIHSTGDSSVANLLLLPDMDRVTVRADIDARTAASCEVGITDADGTPVVREKLPIEGNRVEKEFIIKNPRRWSPEHPHLYRVQLTLSDGRGGVSDRVTAFTGLRRVETKEGRILLNGKPVYLKMLLVQGYYPKGHYTPGDEAEFEREIIRYKSLGFNGVRMHEKIEDPRYLYYCDRHGLLLWEEMPSPFLFGGLDEKQYERELAEVLDRDACHPSVMTVVLFNETWGIYGLLWSAKKRQFLASMYRKVKDFNPGILVVDNSGYDHLMTDIADIHHYLNTDRKIHDLYRILGDKKKMSRQFLRLPKTVVNIVSTHVVGRRPYLRQGIFRGEEPFVISEFGGAGYYKGAGDFMENFRRNVQIMQRYPIITGYCLTQAYDVQNEKNGLLNFDRSEKYPARAVRAINEIAGNRK
jgi:beta-galactosidase/beta-glucuronidase